eukprot:2392935-Rhodomonas_salina.1
MGGRGGMREGGMGRGGGRGVQPQSAGRGNWTPGFVGAPNSFGQPQQPSFDLSFAGWNSAGQFPPPGTQYGIHLTAPYGSQQQMVAPLLPPQYPPPPEQLMPAGGRPAARGPVNISQQNSRPSTDHSANLVQTRNDESNPGSESMPDQSNHGSSQPNSEITGRDS